MLEASVWLIDAYHLIVKPGLSSAIIAQAEFVRPEVVRTWKR